MSSCRNCKWLKETIISDQVSIIECVRPDNTGKLKAHKDVEGCDQFKEKENGL